MGSFTIHSSVCDDDFIKVEQPSVFLLLDAQQVNLMYKNRGVDEKVLERHRATHTPCPEVSAGERPAGRHQGGTAFVLFLGSYSE